MPDGITTLIKKLPAYASDIKENIKKIFHEESCLSQEELYSVALSVGYALKHEGVLNNIRADAKIILDEVDANACKIAAVMMRMNNIFFHFRDVVEDQDISKVAHNFHMETLRNIDIDEKAFEMCCLGVSILNKCEYCINVHIKKLQKRNVETKAVVEIAKIVAVLAGAVDAMEIDRMRTYDFIVRGANMDD